MQRIMHQPEKGKTLNKHKIIRGTSNIIETTMKYHYTYQTAKN